MGVVDQCADAVARQQMYPKSAYVSVIAANADLDHGKWLPMLKEIGISHTTAKQLMTIGGNPAVSDGRNCDFLPTAARALYELSRLDPSDIEGGIKSGAITPAAVRRRNGQGGVRAAPAVATLPEAKIFPVDNGGKRNHNTRANNPTTLKSCGKCPCGRMWTTKTQGVERRNHTGVTLDVGVRSNPNTASSGSRPAVLPEASRALCRFTHGQMNTDQSRCD